MRKERKGRKQFSFSSKRPEICFIPARCERGRYTIFSFVDRNEFIVPYCLRQYLGLTVRCRRHDFLPMMNNWVVKFRKMAIKIKKVVIVIRLKEISATVRREERFWNILPRFVWGGAQPFYPSWFQSLIEKNKIFHTKTAIRIFSLITIVLFILTGFCFQIKSNTILLTSVAKLFGVSI